MRIEQQAQPFCGLLRRNCLVDTSVQRRARPKPAKGPRPRSGIGNARCDPVTDGDLVLRIQMFECSGETDHFIEPFRLNALQLRLMLWLHKREAAFEMRLQIIPDLDLTRFAHTARHSAPHNPEFDPNRFFLVKGDKWTEQCCSLFAPPFVQRITESRTQRVSSQLKPDPLVIGGTAPAAGVLVQRTPELAQYRKTPLFSRSQRQFQMSPHLLRFRRRVARSRPSSTEDLFDMLSRVFKT